MLYTILLTIAIFMAIAGLMAIGVLFGRKPLQGSCGGISAVTKDGTCSFCGKKQVLTECAQNNTAHKAQ